jgi:hypothetical protein
MNNDDTENKEEELIDPIEQDQDPTTLMEENESPREILEKAIIGEDDNQQDEPFNE